MQVKVISVGSISVIGDDTGVVSIDMQGGFEHAAAGHLFPLIEFSIGVAPQKNFHAY